MPSHCKSIFPLVLLSCMLLNSTFAQDPTQAKPQSKTLTVTKVPGSLADSNNDGIQELYDQNGNPVNYWYASWARTFADCYHTFEDDSGDVGDAWLTNVDINNLDYTRDIQNNAEAVVHNVQVEAGKTTLGASAQSTAAHGTIATATTSFNSVVKPSSTVNGAFDFSVTATAKVYAWAKAVADTAKTKDVAKSEARAKTVHGYSDKFKTINAIADIKLTAKLKNGDEKTSKGGLYDRGRSTKDPVLLTIWNLDTGEQISEQLGFVEGMCNSEGEAWSSYSFDSDEGVLLEADLANAEAAIHGAFDSSWLDDPYGVFGASLANGLFDATGVWATLPWALTYAIAGDPTSGIIAAFLAADYLPSSLAFTTPQAYVDLGYDDQYEVNFFSEYIATDQDTDIIPAPASTLLGVLGVLMLLHGYRRG